MSSLVVLFSLLLFTTQPMSTKNPLPPAFPQPSLIELSQQLLLAAKTQAPTDTIAAQLSRIQEKDLTGQLVSDNDKKAFWINLYNAYTQIILSKNPEQYKKRSTFFGNKVIFVAGKHLSLDQIEHGILRRSKVKWSLGYLNKLFPAAFEKRNRVGKVDYRIHFSLNCGARSCPPIAFYKSGQLDQQLDIATKVYLQGECVYDSNNNAVIVPALMNWFRRDFGGKKKMKILLKKLSVVPENKNPAIHFKKYNWDLFLANYKIE